MDFLLSSKIDIKFVQTQPRIQRVLIYRKKTFTNDDTINICRYFIIEGVQRCRTFQYPH